MQGFCAIYKATLHTGPLFLLEWSVLVASKVLADASFGGIVCLENFRLWTVCCGKILLL